uniref:Cercosporin MFS transporter CTB4 (Cercosporin toxin biosynthesis cluster protein 4) n=1 Tax=Ganoderma boninense TaxID=34458 RepID=A0A5K1JYW2_9APHY|nr:Cercosporin MFS transporter CTB4 (Cercosporin toxin biosynthesis cluster protein 4) [Ganoderma boninense]
MSSSSSSTHAFAKRDMVLGPPLIAGIVVVVVGFNLVIALSWCVFRQRKKLKEAKSRKATISAPVDCEKYETSAAFASSTKAKPSAPRPQAKEATHRAPASGASYYELIRSLQQPAIAQARSSPPGLSPGPPRGSPDSANLKQFILRPQDMKNLDGVSFYPKTKHHHTARWSANLGVPPRASQRRPHSISAETASVYSAASAPRDLHEHLSRARSTFTLEPIPASAPPWVTDLPKPPTPAVLTDPTAMEFVVPLPSPTTSTSECSQAIVEKPTQNATRPAFSPIAFPNGSTLSLARARTNSNPSTPPQIRWLTKGAAKDAANDTAPCPAPSKRPNSISSLSTLFSLQENVRAPQVPPVTVAPLNVRRRSNDSRWGSVDMTRGGAPLVSPALGPSTAQANAPPVLPRRSSKRRAQPPSDEPLRR